MINYKKVKILYIVFLCSLAISCKQYKYFHDELTNNKAKKDEMFLRLKNDNEIFLVFTTKFDDKILIVEGGKVLFDSIINNNKKDKPAKVLKTSKNLNTYIRINNCRKEIILDKEIKKNYNIIYVEKVGKDIRIQFSNDIKKTVSDGTD